MKNIFKNLLLILVSLLFSLAVLEGMSRLVMPIQYGHNYISIDGREDVDPTRDHLTLTPSVTFRQKTHEFDKVTTHTADGFRGTENPDNPDVIFIGDSFTYGTGLADEETIPQVFARDSGRVSVNLGRAGTGTVRQLDILEHFLAQKDWHPQEVKLVVMAMTAALMAGNDLADNLEESGGKSYQKKEAAAQKREKNPLRILVNKRKAVLAHSNLARIIYYTAGPLLRAKLSPEVGAEKLEKALEITKEQFARLDKIAQEKGFTYTIYLIHPMQDFVNGTAGDTFAALSALVPPGKVIDTAPVFSGIAPRDYYYPLDGHLKPEGAAAVAAFIASTPSLSPTAPPSGDRTEAP